MAKHWKSFVKKEKTSEENTTATEEKTSTEENTTTTEEKTTTEPLPVGPEIRMLMDMGFPQRHCEKAMSAVGQHNIDEAVTWILSHSDKLSQEDVASALLETQLAESKTVEEEQKEEKNSVKTEEEMAQEAAEKRERKEREAAAKKQREAVRRRCRLARLHRRTAAPIKRLPSPSPFWFVEGTTEGTTKGFYLFIFCRQ